MTNHPLFRSRRAGLRALAAGVAAALIAPAAIAADWVPDRPIKFVVPFPAGGGADVAARIIAQGLGNKLGGQPVIVENRAGAGGAIGSQVVKDSPADGYTVLVASADTHSIYPHVYAKPLYHGPEFVAIAPITRIAYVLMGRPDLPAKTTAEAVALVKTGKLSYGSWGNGSAAQAAIVLFLNQIGSPPMLHVPYTGAAPATQGLMGSQVDMMMVPMPLAVAMRSKLITYGVSAQKRSEALPDVPTLAEQGYPVDAEFWIGVLGPAKMPPAVIATISKQIQQVVADPEVQKQLLKLGMAPHQLTQPEFQNYVDSEFKRWGAAMRAAGIKIDG